MLRCFKIQIRIGLKAIKLKIRSMKNIISSILLVIMVLGFSSCDNDFDPPKDFSQPLMLYTGTTVNIRGKVSFAVITSYSIHYTKLYEE